MLKLQPTPKKDVEFAALSARVRVLENRLLTRERMEQIIEAREFAEAAKLLTDCGYGELTDPAQLEDMLSQAQDSLFADLGKALGEDSHVLEVFQIKYDYHNAKVLIKAEATGADPERLLVSGGRYRRDTLREDYPFDRREDYSSTFQTAVEDARSLLATSHDPQLADFLLDKACYREMLAAAKQEANPFLIEYVVTSIDAVNLQMTVRAGLTGKTALLPKALLEGGKVPEAQLSAQSRPPLAQLYSSTPLAAAAQQGDELLSGGGEGMAQFQKSCDNAVVNQVSQGKKVPFGLEPVVGYLFARQSELTAIRILLSGKQAELPRDTIRERLRDVYG